MKLTRKLATMAGGPDQAFLIDLARGVPLEVTTPPLQSPGIWPLKSELKGTDFIHQELDNPVGHAN